jgi:hypothetical protein
MVDDNRAESSPFMAFFANNQLTLEFVLTRLYDMMPSYKFMRLTVRLTFIHFRYSEL